MAWSGTDSRPNLTAMRSTVERWTLVSSSLFMRSPLVQVLGVDTHHLVVHKGHFLLHLDRLLEAQQIGQLRVMLADLLTGGQRGSLVYQRLAHQLVQHVGVDLTAGRLNLLFHPVAITSGHAVAHHVTV